MPAPGGHSASTCHCGVHSPVAEGPSPAPHFSHRTWFSVLGHPRGYPVFIKGGTGQHALAVKSQKPNSGKLFAALPGFRGLILGEVAAEAGVPVRRAPWCLIQRRWGARSERSGPGSRRTGVRGLLPPQGPRRASLLLWDFISPPAKWDMKAQLPRQQPKFCGAG